MMVEDIASYGVPVRREPPSLDAAARHRLGLAAVTMSAVAWSLAGLFTRLLTLDSWTMLAWRGLFGGLGLAVVIVATERRHAARAFRIGWPGWLFSLLSAAGMICFITSLRHTTVAHVAVIYATIPFVAAGLGWGLLGERPTRRALAASIAALAGVGLMVGFSLDGGWSGDALAFGMTVCMALVVVVMRCHPTIPTMPAACLSAILCGLVCWPLGHPLAISGSDLPILALFGIANSAVGLSLFTLGAKHLPAIETALIGSLDAPLAPLWVWLAFGETPAWSTLVGGGIVIAAVTMHLVYGRRFKVSG